MISAPITMREMWSTVDAITRKPDQFRHGAMMIGSIQMNAAPMKATHQRAHTADDHHEQHLEGNIDVEASRLPPHPTT